MRSLWLCTCFAVAALAGCRPGNIVMETDYVHVWDVDPDRDPVPFGFWGMNGFQDEDGLAEVGDRFGMTVFHTSTRHPNYGVNDLLPLVRDAGLQINLRLVGGHEYYTDDDGNFDLDAWKAMLDPWEGSGVQQFIDDGTLAHHMLLDDITNFAGQIPSGDGLDEMARYSEQLLPGLSTIVRAEAATMPVPDAGAYRYVDASVNQYRAQDGDIEWYAVQQMSAAQHLGLDLITGLNIANGGDGSSGQPGWDEGHWAMSPDEIRTYGYVLTAVAGTKMFLNWEYDGEEAWTDGSVGSDYFDQPELVEALAYLARRAAGEED